MIPALGKKGAAELHKQLVEFTLNTVQQLSAKRQISIEICFCGCDIEQIQKWLGPEYHYAEQLDGDLGVKMNHAFIQGFEEGYDNILIIGTDCPEMTINDLGCGFDKLEHSNLTLGPAYDGGYYCVGLKAPTPQIFKNVDWGSDRVFKQTIAKAIHLGLEIELLSKRHDIDRPADLDNWYNIANPQSEKISVTIPQSIELEVFR